MKRIISFLIVITVITCLCACEGGNENHEKILSEIASQNAEKNKIRNEFMDSDVYNAAYEYLENILEELMPECKYHISLEPGSFYSEKLNGYVDFSENEQTRIDFFQKAYLSFDVNFWDYEISAEELAKALVDRQVSGRMAADEYGSDYYLLDGAKKEFTFTLTPEV